MIRYCKDCGKPFNAFGTAAYCSEPHYRKCAVCGKIFEYKPRFPKNCCSRVCASKLSRQTIHSFTRICKLCGKPFNPNGSMQIYCKDDHYHPCPICGKPVLIKENYNLQRCCSNECASKLRANTCMERFGVPIVSQNLEVKKKLHDIAVDPTVVAHRKQVSLEHWGTENPSQCDTIKTKISMTVNSDDCKNRTKQTNLERFGAEHAMQTDYGMSRYIKTVMDKYNVPYYCMTDECRNSQGNTISTINRAFGKLLKSLNIKYTYEFSLGHYSYDFRICNTRILIELNPTYTHNAVGNHFGFRRDKYYHVNKTIFAEKCGFHCIHIFDWDDTSKVNDILTNLDNLEFSNIREPNLYFSKGHDKLVVLDAEDRQKLLDCGWLPVYDGGQDVFIR